jgi:hypothetical protein
MMATSRDFLYFGSVIVAFLFMLWSPGHYISAFSHPIFESYWSFDRHFIFAWLGLMCLSKIIKISHVSKFFIVSTLVSMILSICFSRILSHLKYMTFNPVSDWIPSVFLAILLNFALALVSADLSTSSFYFRIVAAVNVIVLAATALLALQIS